MNAEELFHLADDACAARHQAQALFDKIVPGLRQSLPPGCEIHHVGSTAVEGCLTKGDLDIAVRVADDTFAIADRTLAQRFSRNQGSIRTQSFAAFTDEAAMPPLGVQLVVKGSEFDVFHRFVERLRADPAAVDGYNRLKRSHNGSSMSAYRSEKAAFIEKLLSTTTT